MTGTLVYLVGLVAAALVPSAKAVVRAHPHRAGDTISVPLTPARWTFLAGRRSSGADTARFESHGGRPSLFVPDGFAFASDVALQNGTIEADIATYPKGAFMGLAFHVASPDKFEVVFFRPHATDGTVQYAPSFFRMNAWQFFPPPDYAASPALPEDGWIHVRVVVKGVVASVYLDQGADPVLEVHDLAQGSYAGTIGFWGRGGGGYIANVRYRPDTATYAAPAVAFAAGAITDGWSLSDAFPADQMNPDVYPTVSDLRWQPVQAEREGIVLIGRYRQDPNVESPTPLKDRPVQASPGTQVVFARTTLTSDVRRVRKMWIGYSDDVVVFLNGRPLYAGRNGMFYRSPGDLGYVYPYADAVFLPLEKGKNDLLLAVSEATAGWGFVCLLDAR